MLSRGQTGLRDGPGGGFPKGLGRRVHRHLGLGAGRCGDWGGRRPVQGREKGVHGQCRGVSVEQAAAGRGDAVHDDRIEQFGVEERPRGAGDAFVGEQTP
ncbi:MAG: hypothetical protein HND58_14520 [Planctomycetota bacterium]|nr:MAG: hypothetical protein HND58_14520 [Planctomycetota bacterium]